MGQRAYAKVWLDVNLAHLDRRFDYEVPAKLAEQVRPGVRVRVRFAGRLVTGFVSELTDQPDSGATQIQAIERCLGAKPAFTATTESLIRRVADHYAGTFADVAAAAIPPRHAATEKSWRTKEIQVRAPEAGAQVMHNYRNGQAFCEALQTGASPRAAWLVAPSRHPLGDLDEGIRDAVAACLSSGRRALVCLPTVTQVTEMHARLHTLQIPVAILDAELGPAARYRNFLSVLDGQASVIIGTRSAIFAPVPDLGLVVVADENSDAHASPRAPYWHARDIAAMRAVSEDAALLLASHSRGVVTQKWIRDGWCTAIDLSPLEYRELAPRVRAITAQPNEGLLPSTAFRLIRAKAQTGLVLIQAPLTGYRLRLRCGDCSEPLVCQICGGFATETDQGVRCSRCSAQVLGVCPACGGSAFWAPRRGSQSIADELGRALGRVNLFHASGAAPLKLPDGATGVVIATPGAEPRAQYAALIVIEADHVLARTDLFAAEEAVRRWCNAISRVAPHAEGGEVLIVGDSDQPAVQAMTKLTLPTWADRELDDRVEANLPPHTRAARVSGDSAPVEAFLTGMLDHDGIRVLGPLEDGTGRAHAIVIANRGCFETLTSLVKHGLSERSAKKLPGRLRAQLDPDTLG